MPLHLIEDKWKDLGLPKEQFDELTRIGGFTGNIDWLKFFSLACSALGEVYKQGMMDFAINFNKKILVHFTCN